MNREVIFSDICRALRSITHQILTVEDVDEINSCIPKEIDFHIKSGMKTSRAMNKIFTFFGINNHKDYNAVFAQYADSPNPLKAVRKTALSIHLCDFLLMSNGTGWRSCHMIPDGEYSAGVLSYMNDNVSMVFYTFNKDYSEGEIFRADKITRTIFCYENGMLLQSRLYPKDEDISLRENQRALVQDALAKCLDMPNLWSKKSEYEQYVYSHPDHTQYPDYTIFTDSCDFSLLKERFLDCPIIASEHNRDLLVYRIPPMVIGDACYCPKCGVLHDYEERVNCDCDYKTGILAA